MLGNGTKFSACELPPGVEDFNETTADDVPEFTNVFKGGVQPVYVDQHALHFYFDPKVCN